MFRKRDAVTKLIKIRNLPSMNKRVKKCGLCGKTNKVIKTKCCGNYVCVGKYSYMINDGSCYNMHYGYTICGNHYCWRHKGEWQNCQKCKNSLMTERYVWYGTNDYNFVKLENPPSFEPNKCCICSVIIKIGQDGYCIRRGDYYCSSCASLNGYPIIG